MTTQKFDGKLFGLLLDKPRDVESPSRIKISRNVSGIRHVIIKPTPFSCIELRRAYIAKITIGAELKEYRPKAKM